MTRPPHDDATVPVSRRTAPASARQLLVMTGARQWRRDLPASGDLVVGRAQECGVQVDDPSISRRHAVLHLGATLAVTDLGSINGVDIGGRRGPANVPVAFEPGDVLDLGTVQLVVVERAASPEGLPTAHVDKSAPGAPRPNDSPPTLPRSAAMTRLLAITERVAASDLSVLITGETGVGKEHVAETIHRRSRRARGPLVKLNCAALAPTLVENELFGHERGAFTGANENKRGLIEAANGGTLFLDEVGELPAAVQAKLLRVLEERVVRPVGGTQTRSVDVRIVSATHRDLRADVAEGRFREDLFFRLNGVTLAVPPLRARVDEIAGLARHFANLAVARTGGPAPTWDDEVAQVLANYRWPGNVRELRNVVERAVALCAGATVTLDDLPAELLDAAAGVPAGGTSPVAAATAHAPSEAPRTFRGEREDAERARILAALDRCGGNQSAAAEALGMPRRTLVARLKSYGYTGPRKQKNPEK